MFHIVLKALVILMVSAPFYTGTAYAKETEGKKTVCILSAIGEEFHLKKIGIMVFGNEESKVSILDWKFDDRVYTLTKQLLGKKFNIQRIKVPKEGFYSVVEIGYRDYRTEMEEQSRKLSPDLNCTYRLLIVARGSQFSSSNQYVSGIGVVERESFGDPYRYLHVIAGVHLFDGQDHSLLNRWQNFNPLASFEAGAIRGPHQELEFTPETEIPGVKDRANIKEAAWNLLEKDLRATLVPLFQDDEEKKAAEKSKPKKPISPVSDGWPRF